MSPSPAVTPSSPSGCPIASLAYAVCDWPLNDHRNFEISCSAESATYGNRWPEPKNRLLLYSQVCSSAETQVRWFTFRYRVLETRHRVKTKVTPAKAATGVFFRSSGAEL